MAKTFKVGDHVSWNSEAGRVRGKIVKVHKRDVNYKGHVHHATPDEPQEHEMADRGRRRIERHLAEARLPAGSLVALDFIQRRKEAGPPASLP
jgi:hypothetical protein